MTELGLIFNEASAIPLADDRYEVYERLTKLRDVLLYAPKNGLGGDLRVSETFYDIQLAAEYSYYDCLGDNDLDHDTALFFLQLATKNPLLKDADEEIVEAAEGAEAKFNDISSPCYVAAHLLGFPLASFDHGIWQQISIPVKVETLDLEGELETEEVLLPNVSQVGHFDSHQEWLEERRSRLISTGSILWEQRTKLFPHLEFCPRVEAQLQNEHHFPRQFTKLLEVLFDMNRVMSSGGFQREGFAKTCKATSRATLDQFGPRYHFFRENRTSFCCPEHFNTVKPHRVYFGVDGTTLVVGQIRGHLPTARYPNEVT